MPPVGGRVALVHRPSPSTAEASGLSGAPGCVHGDAMSSSPAPSSPVAVHTPADVVLAAPLMLGYWPDNSLCAIFVDAEHRVVLIMRWDADAATALADLPPPAARDGLLHAVHLVAYTAPVAPGKSPAAPDPTAWRHAEDALRDSGVSHGWLLAAGRDGDAVLWTSGDGGAGGLAVRVIHATQVSRRAQRWGLTSWSDSRSEYVGDIATDPVACNRVAEKLRTLPPVMEEASRDAAILAVRDRLADQQVSVGDIAEMLVSLTDVQVRDTVLWDLMHGDSSRWHVIAPRIARLVAAAPETHVAAPATILAILRWQLGDGSRASAAVTRALAADPAYTLARLVDGCLATGMHPSVWRAGLAGLSREECRRAA